MCRGETWLVPTWMGVARRRSDAPYSPCLMNKSPRCARRVTPLMGAGRLPRALNRRCGSGARPEQFGHVRNGSGEPLRAVVVACAASFTPDGLEQWLGVILLSA